MQKISYQLNTIFGRRFDLFFRKAQHTPAAIMKVAIFAVINALLLWAAVPVNTIALNDKFVPRKRKVNSVIIERVLRCNGKASIGKSSEHGSFKATGAGPCTSGKLTGATFGASTKSIYKRVTNHFDSAAHFTGHWVRTAFVIIPRRLCKAFLAFVCTGFRAIASARFCARLCLEACSTRYTDFIYAFTSDRITNTMFLIPPTSAAIGTKAIRVAWVFYWELVEAIFTDCVHRLIIKQSRTESKPVYNTVVE